MYGKRKPRQMPIQGINGMIPQTQAKGFMQGQKRYAQAAQPSQPKKFSTDRIAAALGSLATNDGGAGIRNYDANMQAQMQQQKMIQQLSQGMSPQMAAAVQANPQAVAELLANRQLGHHTVNAGNSVVTYGPNGVPQMHQAAQNFQNGSQIARMDGSGNVTSTDLGMNASDRVTVQNNIATQDLRGRELDETIRYNDITDENTDFSNQTGRMNAITEREQAAYRAANPTSDLGKSPLYMTDADGNVAIGQLGNGQIIQAQTPEGMQILSPYDRAAQQSAGRASGKMQGEAQGALPNVRMRGQQALDTIDAMKTHPGLQGAVGNIQGRLPNAMLGDDERAFVAYANQAQGQAFLQAFEALKGGGVITEIEGLKAEQSLSRMERAQSEQDFMAALNDFQDVIRQGMAVAQERAGATPSEAPINSGLTPEEERELQELERLYGN
jgi:hypothetical protein